MKSKDPQAVAYPLHTDDAGVVAAYLAAIVDSSTDAIISKNLDGIIMSWNRSAERIFGYSAEEMIGQHISKVIPKDRLDEETQIISSIHAGKRIEHFETERRRKDGGTVVVSLTISPIKDADGIMIGASKIARDITEKKRFDEFLRKTNEELECRVRERTQEAEYQQAFLKAILDNITNGIVACDEEGRLSLFNRATKELHGIPNEPLPPEKWAEHYSLYESDGVTPMDMQNVPLFRAFAGEIVKDAEMIVVTKSGDRKTLLASGQALHDENGKKLGAVVSMDDVTEERERQRELRQHRDNLQKLVDLQTKDLKMAKESAEAASEAKSDFLANISHEIRTPMNAIVGLIDVFSDNKIDDIMKKNLSATLKQSSQQLIHLINDLLDVSKIEDRSFNLESVEFDLKSVLADAVNLYVFEAQKKKIDLQHNYSDEDIPLFIGDPIRLRQIVMNLVSNAIKFTDSGAVSVAANVEPEKGDQVRNVIIRVQDTGIGIPKDKLDIVFARFTQADSTITRKYGGTGLGLSICKSLAEIMGGGISVKSEVGIGTEFTLTIPLKVSGPLVDKDHADISEASNTQKKPRILLVEDYEPNVLVASIILEGFGYICDVASNGKQALNMLDAGGIDLVIMDVQMPEMDGFTATRLWRGKESVEGKKRIPIIGMTAHALRGDREKCTEAGMDEYISKPFDTADLKAKISGLLAGSAL